MKSGLSPKDIPQELPNDVKQLILCTFDRDPVMRGEAATKIGAMSEKNELAIPFLLRLLDDSGLVRAEVYTYETKDINVEDIAIDALTRIGNAAVAPCIETVKRPEEFWLFHAMHVLSNIKDSRAVDVLVQAIKHANPKISFRAIDAVQGRYRSEKPWNDPKFLPHLIAALQNQDTTVQHSATCALGNYSDAIATDALLDVLNQGKGKGTLVRQYAIKSLAKQKDPRIIPTLLKTFRDETEHEYVRAQSAESMGSLADAKTLDDLLSFCQNAANPHRVRMNAIMGLSASKDRRFVEPLKALAKDDEGVSIHAL